MPTYCYKTDAGDVVELSFPTGRAPARVLVQDPRQTVQVGAECRNIPMNVLARRCFAAERKGVPSLKGWPMECIASGVNAADAGKLREHLASVGVPTEVSEDGNPIYRDANHRKRALKARGFIDRKAWC